ncbi:MAG: hypothetical protein AB8G05_21385 [Oligoflexales bacterium]
MLKIFNFIIFLLFTSACVSTSPLDIAEKVDVKCQTLEHANFRGFFAVECQLKNLTDQKQALQVSFVRFPHYNEDMIMFVPNYEYEQKLSYQNTFRSADSLHFAPLSSVLAGKEDAQALAALIAQLAKRGKRLDSQSQMGYEKNFLLREGLYVEAHQTINAIVLLQKKHNSTKLPRDIEISVSRPSESILTRSL